MLEDTAGVCSFDVSLARMCQQQCCFQSTRTLRYIRGIDREEVVVLPFRGRERVGKNDEVSCGRPVRVGRGNHKRKG